MMDNFERARKSISPEDEEGEATNARYLQMSDALMATLGQMGVDQIPTVGTEFDYNLHMAIQQVRAAARGLLWSWQQACQGPVRMGGGEQRYLPTCGGIGCGAYTKAPAVSSDHGVHVCRSLRTSTRRASCRRRCRPASRARGSLFARHMS